MSTPVSGSRGPAGSGGPAAPVSGPNAGSNAADAPGGAVPPAPDWLASRKLPRQPVLRAAVLIAASIALVSVVGWGFLRTFTQVNPEVLLSLDLPMLSAAITVWTAALYCQGARWGALLPFVPLPSNHFLALVVGGTNVAHLAVPGPIAEIMAAWFVARRAHSDTSLALSATLFGRLLALSVLAAIVVTTATARFVLHDLPLWAIGVCAVAVLGGFSASCSIALPKVVLSGVARLLGLLPFALAIRLAGIIGGWAAGFVQVGTKARWTQAVAWSAANACTLSVATVLCFRSAGVDISPLDVLLLHGVLSLSTVVMIVLPAGFGAVDALGGAMLVGLGLTDIAGATLCMVALRWVQLISMALGLPAMAWILKASRG